MAAIATVNTYDYAAGTCTLRLVGELSPLSQVTGRPVLGRSRFHLQVHDDEASDEVATDQTIFEVSGREPQFSALSRLVQTYVQTYLQGDALTAMGAVSQGGSTLQPVGLTRHRLTLAVPPNRPKTLELSTLQLADLADTLEQVDRSLQVMPDSRLPRARPRLPLWIGSVAAVGIAALLGNQLLTTAPGPVVLSPGESQTTNESAETMQPLPPTDSQQRLEGANPAADSPSPADSIGSAPATTGEALPAPVTTAPTPSTAPADRAADALPQPAPPPSTRPAPANRPAPARPVAPVAPPQAEARAGGAPLARSESAPATESAPASPSGAEPAPDGSPEAFGVSPDAATRAPNATLEWIEALSQALQQQWRSPADLAAPLRYTLTVRSDGTVETLEPLDTLAVTYQNNPSLPQPGTVIPGVIRDQPSMVEVQFLPTGEVVVVPPDR
ncbi:MAG: DUF4335 domain-containing protein [Nodosilinea sp.]